jgi:hypothetical protein
MDLAIGLGVGGSIYTEEGSGVLMSWMVGILIIIVMQGKNAVCYASTIRH